MSEAYTGVGALSDEKTVVLDQPIQLPPGRVRVIVERITKDGPRENGLDRLYAIRRTLRESGYRPRTREEIDTQIRDERESWDR
jgi:hypothetical protein